MAKLNMESIKETLSNTVVWVYWIVGITIALTISYVLYTRFNKQIAALLVFIATMMAVYYYYVKWFVIDIPWKPITSMCPDFMTPIGTMGTDKQVVCVDNTGAYAANGFGSAVAGTTVANLSIDSVKKDGDVYMGTNSAAGYVITPALDGSISNFCNTLKEKKISFINLCNE